MRGAPCTAVAAAGGFVLEHKQELGVGLALYKALHDRIARSAPAELRHYYTDEKPMPDPATASRAECVALAGRLDGEVTSWSEPDNEFGKTLTPDEKATLERASELMNQLARLDPNAFPEGWI